MTDNEKMKNAIQSVIKNMMDRVIDRALVTDPFIAEKHHASRPLYAALVPDEIFKGSHFERRFVTPFGNVWELLAVEVANAGLGYGKQGHTIQGLVKEERLRGISEVLNRLEHKGKEERRVKPNWKEELAYILDGGGEEIPVRSSLRMFVNRSC